MKTNYSFRSAPGHRSPSENGFSTPRVLLSVTLCLWSVWAVAALSGSVVDGANPVPLINQPLVPGAIALPASSAWQLISPMSMRRTHVAVAPAPDGIYALGGDTDRYVCSWGCGITTSAERYSSATGSWSAIAPMHKSRCYFAAATGSDGRVYAIGGWTPDGDVTNTAEVYSPDTDSWVFIDTMPVRVAMEAATTGQDGRIYVLGGGPVMNQGTTNVLIYDPATNGWSYGPPMLEPLALHGAATGSDGRIYAVAYNSEVCDPVSGVWSFLPPLPTARAYLAGAADRDGQIYALGGCCSPGALKEVDIYSPVTNAWVIGSPMLAQRSTPGVALGGDGRLYAVGGSDDTLNLQSAEVLVTVNRNCVSPPSGLISWWSGDKTADDVQGTNTGTLLNGASFAKGMAGPGFMLDGLDDWVMIPTSSSLNQPKLTVDAWIYLTGNANMFRHVIGKDGVVTTREYSLGVNNVNTVEGFVVVPSGLKAVAGVTNVELNTWYHIAMTHDGLKLRLYLNGVENAVLDAVGDIVPTRNSVGIGGDVTGDLTKGIIDEPQIFSRALTDAEILAIYQAGASGQCKPEIFVSSIDPSYKARGSEYSISMPVLIQDVNGVGIQDATVQVGSMFPDGQLLTFPVKTDEMGVGTVKFSTTSTGLYKFKVRKVSHPTREYNASLNVETTDTLQIP